MLTSRRASRTDPPTGAKATPGQTLRPRLFGFKRLGQAYGITLLAAVLGLPGLAAGLISMNDCQLNGFDCSDRLAYGVISGLVFALAIHLLLSLHFRLGWLFWVSSGLIMAAAATHLPVWPVTVIVVALAPAVAGWVSEPPNQRSGVGRHWVPRLAVLVGTVGVVAVSGVLVSGSYLSEALTSVLATGPLG